MAPTKALVVLCCLPEVISMRRKSENNLTVGACPPRAAIPSAPEKPLDLNGVSWPSYCFEGQDEEHMFILGDWGGLSYGPKVIPAPNAHASKGRFFRRGLDDRAQWLVAQQMMKRAARSKPRLVLNGGDNFYWGGVMDKCGVRSMAESVKALRDPKDRNVDQFRKVFEDMYTGDMSDVPWLLCFGNHDYGGFQFNSAWDQQIAYTWGSEKQRWILPAQYWHQHVDFPTKQTTMDVYMIDTCNQDTTNPHHDAMHNICSEKNNRGANCAHVGGPSNAWDCVNWFKKLWQEQMTWMEEKICASTADWQVIVTHFPPEPYTHYKQNVWDWKRLGDKCGIDFFVGSHRHDQEMHNWGQAGIPYVVAGGGGGITSERRPGDNTQYGFFDMIIEKDKLLLTSINQYGNEKGRLTVRKRLSEKEREAAKPAEKPASMMETDAELELDLQMDDASFNVLEEGDFGVEDAFHEGGSSDTMVDMEDEIAARRVEMVYDMLEEN